MRQTLLEIGTDVYQQKEAKLNNSSMFDGDNSADDDNSVKAVVSISDNARIEGGSDLDLDNDYESID